MHECAHRTLFRSRRLNRAVGPICGGLLATSYRGFSESHWQHHRHCGTHEDSGEGDYLLLDRAGPSRMLWHLIRPLTGVVAVAAIREYHARPASSTRQRTSRTGAGYGLEVVGIVAMQTLVAWIATGSGRHLWLAFVYPASAATFGVFFSRTRAFCEHVSSNRAPGQCFVRSHLPNWFDRMFFYTLNMNLHVEHHLYPSVPARQLSRVRRELERAGYFTPEMTATSILRTICGRLSDARRLNLS